MPYTAHGHWFGDGEPTGPRPDRVTRCNGLHGCPQCKMDAELVSMLASPKKGIALKFGDQISNGAHVLAYTGIHSSTRITRAVALCWCPTRKEFVIWTIEYGYADQGEAWYAHNGHRAGQDLAYALLSYTQQAGPGASLPNFIY